MMQSLFLHKLPFLKNVACTVPDKTVSQMYLEKTENWISKQRHNTNKVFR